MNVFVLLRRTLWAIILIICITIVAIYFAVMQLFLSPQGLQTLADKSQLAQTVRDDVLLPKVLDAAKSSQYNKLLDESVVKDAFYASVPLDAFSKKLHPAIASTNEWLNSKQPDVSFSIDVSDLSNTFADKVSSSVASNIDKLPTCTFRNSIEDVESFVCRSPLIPVTNLKSEVTKVIKSQATLGETTITPATIAATDTIPNSVKNLPDYLNMFYGLTIVAAGIGILTALWLLIKHRLSGIITVGAASVVSAGVLYGIAQLSGRIVSSFSSEALVKQFTQQAALSFESFMKTESLWLLVGGTIAIVLASLIKFAIHNHHAKNTMHAEHHGTNKRTLN